MPSYAGTWAQSWTVLFPDDGSGSDNSTIQNRDMRAQANFVLDYLPVGADLSFMGISSVSIPYELTKSGSTARIETPFSISGINGRLRVQREISNTLYFAGGSAGDDIFQYGKTLSNTSPLWREVPVYALFNSRLDSAMENMLSNYSTNPENIRFHELLAYNLAFPERYNWLALIVPVTHYTQFDRNMEQRMDTLLDVFTVSSGFGFSSINLFGAMGAHSTFKFYRNDEIRYSISGIISFPHNKEPLWKIQAEQTMRFFGFADAELDFQNTYTVIGGSRTGGIDSAAILWTMPRDKTLLSSIYANGMGRIAEQANFPSLSELSLREYERFFRESLELVLDFSNEYSVYSFTLGHESVVRIIGRLTLTAFAKLGVQKTEQIDTLNLLLSFGTTFNISF
jgi:hypothetical protein